MTGRLVTIVDYGIGNVDAIANMLEFLGIESRLGTEPGLIADADLLVLPGVGAFDRAMQTLERKGLVATLSEAVVARKVPVLGVCLGMQLLARGSEEGDRPGLGWLDAEVKRIPVPAGSGLKVPHIGWAEIDVLGRRRLFPEASVALGPGPRQRYYFDHSYYMECVDPGDTAAVVHYGSRLCCAVERGNICGVQFHPEKSHRFGMRLLASWVESAGGAATP